MANPSLQIGNDNWAIKEDNLLGYSTAGTRFVPQPITMTRASAGTRVNPQGLVETVELLGSELTSPLNFLSTWLEASVDSKTYNTFTVGGSGRGMYFMLPENKTLTINVSGVTGSVELRYRTTTGGAGTVLGDFDTDLYLTTTNATTNIYLRATGAGTVSVTDVSVKESTKNDLARVDYTDGTSSLLAEPQRTNLITYSEEISQYSQSSSTVIDNSTTSPDGTVNASKVTKNGVNSNDRITTIITTINSTNYSLSAFIKNDDIANGGVSTIGARITGGTVFRQGYEWNGSALSVTTANQSGTRTNVLLEDFGNGWYKVGFSFTSDGTETRLEFDIDRANGTDNTAIFLWGAQMEEGSYATSYIPTNGEAGGVTRVQDQYEKTGISDKINSAEGVLFVEMAALSDDLTYRIISLSDGTDDERIYIQYTNASNTITVVIKQGGDTQANISYVLSDETVFSKIAIKWKAGTNETALWVNGFERGTATLGDTPIGLNRLALDRSSDLNTFFGKVKQLQVYKTALTNPQLATLTT